MKLKTLITTTLGLAIAFAFASCSNAKSDPSSTNDISSTAAAQTPTSNGTTGTVSELPTVIDFNADWCGPCKQFAPIFHEAEKKYAGKLNFVSINVDERQDLAQQFGIQYLPTIVFVDTDGREKARFSGYMDATEFEKAIQKNI